MSEYACDQYEESECVEILKRLFPQGIAGDDVMRELASEGWEVSPLLRVFHPTVEQSFKEAVQTHRNLESLRRPDEKRPPSPEPTLEEVRKSHRDEPAEPKRELGELVGRCLWDIFSNNHEVLGADGRCVHLGSFRGSGGFIADFLNDETGTRRYNYTDFYMGTLWVSGRADMIPVYEMIFRRLRAHGLDWVFHFPRLYAVDLRPLREALDKTDTPEWTEYSPEKALAQQREEKERDEAHEELREILDKGYRESLEAAKHHPPPDVVLAYQRVYGRFPRGWPPWEAGSER
jgi:hypothetical protein